MHITLEGQAGTLERGRKAVVREWKRNPDNFDDACHAAGHYARRDNCRMVVIPGNSYGRRCFHITTEADSFRKFFPGCPDDKWVRVGVVDADGNVFMAQARNKTPN